MRAQDRILDQEVVATGHIPVPPVPHSRFLSAVSLSLPSSYPPRFVSVRVRSSVCTHIGALVPLSSICFLVKDNMFRHVMLMPA